MVAVSGISFTHQITRLEVNTSEPEGLSGNALKNVHTRIARKAGYEKVSGNVFAPQSRLSKFNHFSAGGRNTSTTARAYYESGHLLTASILRATHQEQIELSKSAERLGGNAQPDAIRQYAEKDVWEKFKTNPAIQRNFKRQDYVNHRRHMLKSGQQTNTSNNQIYTTTTQGNQFSRIATKISRIAISVCECTSAPTGFTYRVLRNVVFHAVGDNSMMQKAGTVIASFAIGMGATAIIKATRDAAGTAGYGFNPIQMLTGVLCAFAAVSATAGLVSWIAGLVSQAGMKNLDPSDEQKAFIQFEMNSTLNKINELLLDSKDNLGKMRLLNKAMLAKFPTSKTIETIVQKQTIFLHPMLQGWIKALNTNAPLAEIAQLKKASTPEEKEKYQKAIKEKDLKTAKEFLGKYLNDREETLSELFKQEDGKVVKPQTKQELMRREKEFATLAGFVEHADVEPKSLNEELVKAAEEKQEKPQTHGSYRRDARVFTEDFAKSVNRKILRGLSYPAKGIDKAFRTNDALSNKFRNWASKEYGKPPKDPSETMARAHLDKYKTDYISAHLHQYGPITRSLMLASDMIHSVNYNYVLAVNAQTSRLFNKLAQWGQDKALGQHSSRTMCGALGRFWGGATVTLVSFFGISALAGLTAGGGSSDGFQNMSEAGSAKLSWLVTGTLMSLIGIPAFALGLMAKGAARIEGWKGDIEKPLPRNIPSHKLVFV